MHIADDIGRPSDFRVKYRAFNESRARTDLPPAGLRTPSVKLTRRYGLLMNAMDLRVCEKPRNDLQKHSLLRC